MSVRNLYLYEVVDVVGQGQYAYMEHLWQDPVLRMPEMFGLHCLQNRFCMRLRL